MKRLLITGASGFIGSFLCEKGLELGYEVWAGIRKTSSRKYLQNKELKFIELTFEDKNILKTQINNFNKDFGKFDFIIHNAGCTKSPKIEDYRNINFINTQNFIDVLKETNNLPEKFLFTSSLAAFGPGKDNSLEPVMLNQKPNPVNLYGKSKLEAEDYIKKVDGLNYIILRPTGVYGPREKDYFLVFKMINNKLEVYIGADNQKITFIYVKDLVRAYYLALESDVVNKSYFLSETGWYETKTFYSYIKKALNKKANRIVFPLWIVKTIASFNDMIGKNFGNYPTLNSDKLSIIKATNWICETQPLKDDLNFVTEYNLEKGVNETALWYKENGWLK